MKSPVKTVYKPLLVHKRRITEFFPQFLIVCSLILCFFLEKTKFFLEKKKIKKFFF